MLLALISFFFFSKGKKTSLIIGVVSHIYIANSHCYNCISQLQDVKDRSRTTRTNDFRNWTTVQTSWERLGRLDQHRVTINDQKRQAQGCEERTNSEQVHTVQSTEQYIAWLHLTVKEEKAVRTFAIIFAILTCCFVPYIINTTLESFCQYLC